MKSLHIITIFLFSCIYADTDPPDPSSLSMPDRKVQLQATLGANTNLILRFWHQGRLTQVPFEEDHISDNFGIYINQFDWPIQSQTFSLWMNLDENSNSEIDSPDRSIVLLDKDDPKILILETQFTKGLIACTPNPARIPSETGDYYCLFTPQEETFILEDKTPFAYYRPYANWQKTTGQKAMLKPVFLPAGSYFYGKCVLDANSNAHYDFQETVFQISGFTPTPDCHFTISL